jgi:hypothetical protein
MELTQQQQGMMTGKEGEGAQRAMEILMAYGQCYDAKRLIPVTSVHMAGNFPVLLDEGIEWLEDLAKGGTRVKVFTRRCMTPFRPMK